MNDFTLFSTVQFLSRIIFELFEKSSHLRVENLIQIYNRSYNRSYNDEDRVTFKKKTILFQIQKHTKITFLDFFFSERYETIWNERRDNDGKYEWNGQS